MAGSPEVLLLDDGELDDIQAMLDALGISYGRVRGAAIAGQTPAPRKLLVTTPRRIDAVPIGGPDDEKVVRIVVVSEDSPTLRAQLRDVGFDYLVRRPVHSEALRLMLLRCLFNGSERRREERVPVGFEVSYRMGLLPKRALLADLSTRGCRILSKWAAEPGKRITLTLPPRSGSGEALSLRGKVVRMTLDEHLAPAGPYSAAVEFETLSDADKTELELVLEERARGPAQLAASEGSDAAGKPPPAKPAPRPARPKRARARRAKAAAPAVPLDPPETRGEHAAHDIGVEVEVQLTQAPADDGAAAAAECAKPAATEASPAAAPEVPDAAEATHEVAAPPTHNGDANSAAGDATSSDGDENETQRSERDRRSGPRASYERRIPAFGERAMRVLVARDLSMGGMRVQRDSGLAIGDRLHLAIYGAADAEPFLIWASVDRDDGDRGLLLAFDPVPPAIAEQLDQVVVNLPAVESLHDDEAHAMGTVVTEILVN